MSGLADKDTYISVQRLRFILKHVLALNIQSQSMQCKNCFERE